jgi:hypothetical protein
VHHVA